jgi:hypothetical protein
MGHGMAGVRREGTATCDVYADVRLVGRRGAAALRPVGAGHMAQGRGSGRRFHGTWTSGQKPASACDPGKPRRGDMQRQRGRALERQGTHPNSA